MEIDQCNYNRNRNIQFAIEGREYRSNYHREYRKRCPEQMNDTKREHQKLNQNQQERQRIKEEYKRREQDQRNETKGEIQSLYPSQQIDKESEETSIVGMNNENLVDRNVSEMDCTKILQEHTVPQMEIDQHNCTRNINIQYVTKQR